MASHLDSHKFLSLLLPFKNASLMNSKGELLFSKDADSFKTTTSRIVLFQIVKKYLPPKVGDIIISNDPENGGTQLNRVFFISCLHPNLYIVWDAELNEIHFKIPLTPLVERNKKNQIIWSALIETQPAKDKFQRFFENQINKISQIKIFDHFIATFSSEAFQKSWFNVTKDIFEDHFNLKSYGQHQLAVNYRDKQIKMTTTADEKLDAKLFTLDLSGTSAASDFSCASHVVESGLMIEISKFYHLEKALSQPILDKVKLLLPPRSIVSKAIPTGEYNFELQKLTRQMIRFCLGQMNIQGKKTIQKFNMYSTYYLSLNSSKIDYSNFLSNSRIDFEYKELFNKKILRHSDREYQGELVYEQDEPTLLSVYGISALEDQDIRWIKVNDKRVHHGVFNLKKGDQISFKWKI